MMQGITTGVVKADPILVDTLQRFGRVDEFQSIRRKLYEKHGVLVLTANTDFADPHTPQGRALGTWDVVQTWRISGGYPTREVLQRSFECDSGDELVATWAICSDACGNWRVLSRPAQGGTVKRCCYITTA
jgi:hypothetical protein